MANEIQHAGQLGRVALTEEIAEKIGTSQAAVDSVLDALFEVFETSVAAGEKITIPGWLAVERTDRAARSGRNPSTGETIQIAAGHSVKLTAGSRLKAAVTKRRVVEDAPTQKEDPTLVASQTTLLVQSIGLSPLAGLLGVSKNQISRWAKGEQAPSPENVRALLELEGVFAQVCRLWPPDVALDWFHGSNSYLGGARPIDVLKLHGATQLIEAVEAAMAGSFV